MLDIKNYATLNEFIKFFNHEGFKLGVKRPLFLPQRFGIWFKLYGMLGNARIKTF